MPQSYPPAVNDVANARGGDADFHCQRVLRDAEREKKLLAQHLARMCRYSLHLPSRCRSFNRYFRPPISDILAQASSLAASLAK
jgi:hypothetical protein